jgi:hypothetical protein
MRHASPDHRTQLGTLLPDLLRDAQCAAHASAGEDRRRCSRRWWSRGRPRSRHRGRRAAHDLRSDVDDTATCRGVCVTHLHLITNILLTVKPRTAPPLTASRSCWRLPGVAAVITAALTFR